MLHSVPLKLGFIWGQVMNKDQIQHFWIFCFNIIFQNGIKLKQVSVLQHYDTNFYNIVNANLTLAIKKPQDSTSSWPSS